MLSIFGGSASSWSAGKRKWRGEDGREEEGDEEDEDREWVSASDDNESMDVSDPVRDKTGSSTLFISPKNLEANCTASECGTPAKATTVLSGR